MVRAFWLVLKDLWDFVCGRDSDALSPTILPLSLDGRQSPLLSLHVPTSKNRQSLPIPVIPPLLDAGEPFMAAPVHNDTPLHTPLPMPDWPQAPTMYYVATDRACMHLTPHLDFDSALTQLSLGQVVQVLRFVGRYAEVAVHDYVGFVQKDDLVLHREMVWPNLIPGTVYDAVHVVTHKIRKLINDEFIGGHLGLTLQAGEYILWRLKQDNCLLTWPKIRPRVPGKWHHILRGQALIKVHVSPRVDTVMEWYAEDGMGRLAYVEAVLPDETLRISGVGIAVSGEYSELVLKPSVWREWRPVFISVDGSDI